MAVGAATAFYPIQQPGDRDAILRVGASAWCAAMQFPCQPASSMSAEAAATLLAAFSRFLVGAFSTLPETVRPQLVILQEPLRLEDVARRFEEAATRLASVAPPTSDVAWQWAGLLHQLRGGHLATRRGAVILTASRPTPTPLERLRRTAVRALTADEATVLLGEAVRHVADAAKDAGFTPTPLVGADLAAFITRWTRGEMLAPREATRHA